MQTPMPWVGFEPTFPAFERAKTVHAVDRGATVIGNRILSRSNFKLSLRDEKTFSDSLNYDMAVLLFYTLHHKLWALHTPFRTKHTNGLSVFAYVFPSLFALGVYMLYWFEQTICWHPLHTLVYLFCYKYRYQKFEQIYQMHVLHSNIALSYILYRMERVMKWSYMHLL
jgi:hypothetical protein